MRAVLVSLILGLTPKRSGVISQGQKQTRTRLRVLKVAATMATRTQDRTLLRVLKTVLTAATVTTRTQDRTLLYSPQLQNALGRKLANQLLGLMFFCLDRAPAGGAKTKKRKVCGARAAPLPWGTSGKP